MHRAGAIVLAMTVLIAPWLIGGVLPEHQQWLFGAVAITVMLWGVSLIAGRAAPQRLPWLTFVLTTAVALGMLQLLPLKVSSVQELSPRAAALWSTGPGQLQSLPISKVSKATTSPTDSSIVESVGVNKPVEFPSTDAMTISLAPEATRSELALLGLALVVFVLGSVLFRDADALRALLFATLLNGAAIAFFGVVQQLTWNGQLFWQIPLTQGGVPFGPFVNRNNAAGYLCLCLAAGIGWVLCEHRGASSAHKPDSGLRWLRKLRGRHVAGAAALITISTGIISSGSRGGCLALAAGLVAVLVSGMAFQRRGLLIGLTGFVAVGAALAVWLGAVETLQNRVRMVSTELAAQHGRLANWNDGARATADFLATGSGLGTYRHIYGLYQERFDEQWYLHAENQYLETLVTAGIPGVCLLAAAIGLFALTVLLLPSCPGRNSRAFCIAGVVALVTQLVAGLLDFGLYLPAGMMLLALLCGGLSGFACESLPAGFRRGLASVPCNRFVAGLLCGLLAVSCTFGGIESHGQAVVDGARAAAKFDRDAEPQHIRQAIVQLQQALRWRPDDWQAHGRAAELSVLLARIELCQRQKQADRSVSADEAWLRTTPLVWHGRVYELTRDQQTQELANLRGDEVVQTHLRRACLHLERAARACPLRADVCVRLAELMPVVFVPEALAGAPDQPTLDVNYLERARQLAPGDERVWFHAGLLDFQAGRLDAAWASWRQALTLSPRSLEAIAVLARTKLNWNELTERVLPSSPGILLDLASAVQSRPLLAAEGEAAERLCRQAIQLLSDATDSGQNQILLGQAHVLLGELPTAVEHYSRAVELEPRHLSWRCRLVELLRQSDRRDEALEQVRVCAGIDPHDPRVQSLFRDLSREQLKN